MICDALGVAERDHKNRNHECTDGEVVQAQQFPATHPSLILYLLRRQNLPRRENAGVVTRLTLARGESLAEATYISFFPRNVVGVLYNQMGPSQGRLEEYLRKRFGLDVTIVPVYREDSLAIIEGLKLSSVRIGIPADQVQFLSPARGKKAKNFAASLEQMSKLVDGGVVEAGLSIGRLGPASERASAGSKIKGVVNQLFRETELHRYTKAVVEGRDATNEKQVINLLHDRLIQSVEISDQAQDQLDQTSERSLEALESAWDGIDDVIDTLIEPIASATQHPVISFTSATA